MTNDRWNQLVEAIALDQHLVTELLRTHLADAEGLCLVCEARGQHLPWPCGIRQLAEQAKRGRPR